jgi:hypothetical protein
MSKLSQRCNQMLTRPSALLSVCPSFNTSQIGTIPTNSTVRRSEPRLLEDRLASAIDHFPEHIPREPNYIALGKTSLFTYLESE